MPAIFEYEHLVVDDEIDELAHVNNAFYIHWMQSAAVAHSSAQGWTSARYRQLDAAWVARTHQIEYLQPAGPGDLIIVRTWVADMQRASSLRRYEMIRASDRTALARAETRWAFIRLSTGRPTRIPLDVQNAFELVTDLD